MHLISGKSEDRAVLSDRAGYREGGFCWKPPTGWAAGLSLSFVSAALKRLPLYELGFGWVSVAALALAVSFALCALKRDKKPA